MLGFFLMVTTPPSVGEPAKCFTPSCVQHSCSDRLLRRDPDPHFMMTAPGLNQIKVVSLSLRDAHLCWAPLRLQKAAFSLRQTLVVRHRHGTHGKATDQPKGRPAPVAGTH